MSYPSGRDSDDHRYAEPTGLGRRRKRHDEQTHQEPSLFLQLLKIASNLFSPGSSQQHRKPSLLRQLLKIAVLALETRENQRTNRDHHVTLRILHEAHSMTKEWSEIASEELHYYGGRANDTKDALSKGPAELLGSLILKWWKMRSAEGRERRFYKTKMLQEIHQVLVKCMGEADDEIRRIERKLGRRRRRHHDGSNEHAHEESDQDLKPTEDAERDIENFENLEGADGSAPIDEHGDTVPNKERPGHKPASGQHIADHLADIAQKRSSNSSKSSKSSKATSHNFPPPPIGAHANPSPASRPGRSPRGGYTPPYAEPEDAGSTTAQAGVAQDYYDSFRETPDAVLKGQSSNDINREPEPKPKLGSDGKPMSKAENADVSSDRGSQILRHEEGSKRKDRDSK